MRSHSLYCEVRKVVDYLDVSVCRSEGRHKCHQVVYSEEKCERARAGFSVRGGKTRRLTVCDLDVTRCFYHEVLLQHLITELYYVSFKFS